MAKPLSAVPLGAVAECKAKSGGKHEGKFYVDTLARSFKLVATNSQERDAWVEAINRGSTPTGSESMGGRCEPAYGAVNRWSCGRCELMQL